MAVHPHITLTPYVLANLGKSARSGLANPTPFGGLPGSLGSLTRDLACGFAKDLMCEKPRDDLDNPPVHPWL